jgi:hypothetical protein
VIGMGRTKKERIKLRFKEGKKYGLYQSVNTLANNTTASKSHVHAVINQLVAEGWGFLIRHHGHQRTYFAHKIPEGV